jgi:hypothetical protein
MSDSRIVGEPEGHVVKVDSGGRMFTKSDCSGRTVTTTRSAFTDSAVSTVVQADPNRCSLTIQVQGSNSFMIAIGATDPVNGDFLIGPNQTHTFPFPLADEVRGIGVGGPGNFVAISAKQVP